jgi:hypothetical protein
MDGVVVAIVRAVLCLGERRNEKQKGSTLKVKNSTHSTPA